MNFFKLFSDKTQEVFNQKQSFVLQSAPKSVWRNNMWVMTPDGVGIIFDLKEPVVIHLVSTMNGETIRTGYYQSEVVRQAKFDEIPACRQCSRERATELGYL